MTYALHTYARKFSPTQDTFLHVQADVCLDFTDQMKRTWAQADVSVARHASSAVPIRDEQESPLPRGAMSSHGISIGTFLTAGHGFLAFRDKYVVSRTRQLRFMMVWKSTPSCS